MPLKLANVNWYDFLPAAMAIFVLIVTLRGNYLSNMLQDVRIHTGHGRTRALDADTRRFVHDVAVDWNTRLTFISTMIIAFFSCLSSLGPRNLGLAIGTFAVLGILFIAGLWWILGHKIGRLASQYRFFGWSNAALCNYALVGVYALLTLEIFLSEALGATPLCK